MSIKLPASFLLAAWLLRAVPLHAHGMPVDLAFWGDFSPAVSACQRAIGTAAATCGLQTWRLRRDCALGRLRGLGCDEGAVTAAAQAARQTAQNAVSASCTTAQVSILQFLSTFEAFTDVNTFCREIDAAATSVLLDPLTAELPQSSAAAACVTQTWRNAGKLFAFSFRSRLRLLDRIAVSTFTPTRKRALLAASTADITAAADALSNQLAATCPADTFPQLFGQPAADAFTKLGSRADCLAGQTYAQGGILCPTPTCGNRMVEHGEECDDGNASDGDGCSQDCLNE